MTSFALKIIALITMSCDHIGYVVFHQYTLMNLIGKIAFPIFAFQISEGYNYTKNLKLYFFRLFLFAIVSQLPFMLFLSSFTPNYLTLNIFFTLFLGLLAITIFDKSKNKLLGCFSVIVIILISELLDCDYGWFGTSIIFLFYYLKNNKVMMNIAIIIVTLIKYISVFLSTVNIFYIYMMLFSCFSLIFINLYNGRKGKNIKYLLYTFYPVHLMLLYLITLVI